MAREEQQISRNLDWVTVLLFLICVGVGWSNIYAAVYDPEHPLWVFDKEFYDTNAGKQIIWIGTTILLIISILVIDYRFYETFAFFIYGFFILLLIGVILFGATINGSHSWFKIGGFSLQPAEFAKMATVLALARYISTPLVNLTRFRDQFNVALIVAVPPLLIIASNETGSALVFASLMIVLYREGLPGIYPAILLTLITLFILALLVESLYIFIGLLILAGIIILIQPRYERTVRNAVLLGVIIAGMMALVFAVDFVIEDVLKEHQRNRIKVLIDPTIDRKGVGYHVTQSKIAIGSGGLLGKGFLEGTQTKFDFVPEQSTDFIFCTIGEEHGFLGSIFVISLFIALLLRLVYLADRQKSRFARVYGYGVASIIFFHFLVNLGMTIGLMPVIGIPLPFFSYGGSSLWSFSILLFIFLKLDSQRSQMLARW
ncbi:rod shape determining protein RodA [Pseudarcicella hirudinis]|uniref:Cell wall polymerase n=1 Tax=Pseudarcicella hirudinis TaxID=1079859 RepID=A0A1I5W1E3_9BACT|nr:rod shape-determining protein RodA [Pseudarcicella hirudinis]SFQ13584.1 rod shape determining protein RodA [Pseudarcicella hirudinis]